MLQNIRTGMLSLQLSVPVGIAPMCTTQMEEIISALPHMVVIDNPNEHISRYGLKS